MKTKCLLVLSLLIGVLYAGCASSAELNKVHIGMTKSEVTGILGSPDSMSAQANVEYLTYYLTSESGYGRDQPYMVRLVDDKVESFGRFAQLFDLMSRPAAGSQVNYSGYPTMGTTVYTTQTPRGRSSDDLATQIMKLKALKDQGALSDEEFQKAKDKLLNSDATSTPRPSS